MKLSLQLKKLTGETFIYGISGIISKFISLFLLPFYARKLSPAEYGDIGLLNSIYFFIVIIVCLGLDSAVYRWFFDKDNKIKNVSLFNNWFSLQFKLSSIIVILGVISTYWFSQKFLVSKYSEYLLLIICINVLLNLFYLIITEWLRINLKAKQTVLFSIGLIALSFTFSSTFILYFNLSVFGFFLGQTLAQLIVAVIAIIKYPYLYRFIKVKYTVIKPLLSYGLSIIPATLSATIMLMVTSFLIQSKLSSSSLGLYQMGNNFASIIMLFTSAFAQAWAPFSFSIMNEPNHKTFYAKVLDIYFSVVCLLAFAIALLANEFILIIATEKFAGSARIAGILAYLYFLTSLSVIAITGMAITKKVKQYSQIVIFASIVTIILEYVLIRFDKEGVAFGMLLGQALIPILIFYYSQKKYKIPYNFIKITFILILSGVLLYFSSYIHFDSILKSIAIKISIIIFLLIIILWFEKKAILNLIKLKR